MTTHDVRRDLHMSQVDLSEAYGIPLATIRNWDARGRMPDYIHALLVDIVSLKSELAFIKETYWELLKRAKLDAENS